MTHIRNVTKEHNERTYKNKRKLEKELGIAGIVSFSGLLCSVDPDYKGIVSLVFGFGLGVGCSSVSAYKRVRDSENTRYEAERGRVIDDFVEGLSMFDVQVLNEFLNYQGERSLRNIDLSDTYGPDAVEFTLERLNDLTYKTGDDYLAIQERLKSKVNSAIKKL